MWLSRYSGQTLLLHQAGMFADDPYLDAILAKIYADRGQSEYESSEAF